MAKLGPKKAFLLIFDKEFLKNIVIFEIRPSNFLNSKKSHKDENL